MDPYLHYDLLRRTHRALALKAKIPARIEPSTYLCTLMVDCIETDSGQLTP